LGCSTTAKQIQGDSEAVFLFVDTRFQVLKNKTESKKETKENKFINIGPIRKGKDVTAL
jgi:hypothetical protein